MKPSTLSVNQSPSSATGPESLTKARAPRAPLPPIDSVFGYRIDDGVTASGLSRATIYRLIKEQKPEPALWPAVGSSRPPLSASCSTLPPRRQKGRP